MDGQLQGWCLRWLPSTQSYGRRCEHPTGIPDNENMVSTEPIVDVKLAQRHNERPQEFEQSRKKDDNIWRMGRKSDRLVWYRFGRVCSMPKSLSQQTSCDVVYHPMSPMPIPTPYAAATVTAAVLASLSAGHYLTVRTKDEQVEGSSVRLFLRPATSLTNVSEQSEGGYLRSELDTP